MKRYNTSIKCLLALFALSTLAPATMHGMNNDKDKWGTAEYINAGVSFTAAAATAGYFAHRNFSKKAEERHNLRQENQILKASIQDLKLELQATKQKPEQKTDRCSCAIL